MNEDRRLENTSLGGMQAPARGIDSCVANKPMGRRGGARILCVDDDMIGLKLRGEILTRHGYIVDLDSSPLQTLGRNLLAFDLAIIDYEMPTLNGVELLMVMRARRVTYPIILLTGALGRLALSEQILFDRCIEKGQPGESFLQIVDSCVRTKGLPDHEEGGLPKYRRWVAE